MNGRKRLRANQLVRARLTTNFDPRLFLDDPGSLTGPQLASATAMFGPGPHNIGDAEPDRWIIAHRDQTRDEDDVRPWFRRGSLSDGTVVPQFDPDLGQSGRWVIRGRFDIRFKNRYDAGDFGSMPVVNFVEL